jgi:hypothetical protein
MTKIHDSLKEDNTTAVIHLEKMHKKTRKLEHDLDRESSALENLQ